MPSDLKNYFGFVVDEFSELVHTIKSLRSQHYFYLWRRGQTSTLNARQECSPDFNGKPYLNPVRVFDLCLEMLSDSKKY